MAYLSSPTRFIPVYHRCLFFSASSSPPAVPPRCLLPTLSCHDRDLLDVMPKRGSRSPGTEESRAGPVGAPRGTNRSTV
ncbi:unnamed protein product [Urochloa humidicola]